MVSKGYVSSVASVFMWTRNWTATEFLSGLVSAVADVDVSTPGPDVLRDISPSIERETEFESEKSGEIFRPSGSFGIQWDFAPRDFTGPA